MENDLNALVVNNEVHILRFNYQSNSLKTETLMILDEVPISMF